MDKVNLFFIYLDITAPLAVFLMVLFAVLYRGMQLMIFDRILVSFLLGQVLLNSLANFLQDHQINNHWVYHLNCITTQVIFSIYLV